MIEIAPGYINSKSKRYWRPQQVEQLKELSKNHYFRDIAKIMNRSEISIRKKIYKLGFDSVKNDLFWTIEEDNKLRELCNGTMSFESMKPYFPGRDGRAIHSHAQSYGITNNFDHRLYTHNKDYFTIPNPISSWIAGFIFADAHVDEKNNSITFILNNKDRCILETIRKELNYTGKIYEYDQIQKSGTISHLCKMKICGAKKIKEDLAENFGITSIKTSYGTPTGLQNDYLKYCFCIGEICGDGCIYMYNGTKKWSLNISIVSCNYGILEWVRDTLAKITGKPGKIYQKQRKDKENRKTWTFCVTHDNAFKILDYLKDFPVPKLDRKWQNPRILERLAWKKQNNPHLFSQFPISPVINNEEILTQIT